MRKWLNTYFDFTRSEFNGLLALFFLILVVSLFPYTFRWIWPENHKDLADAVAIHQLEWRDSVRVANRRPYERGKPFAERNIKVSDFDPNDLDLASWQNLGLSPKQAQAVMRFTEKGGRFRTREDVQKMYTISPQLYAQLEQHIKIKNTSPVPHSTRLPAFTPKAIVIININTTDTLELQEIRGVGPAFARRIAKYRERLGGFHNIEQLREVYGIDSIKYEELKTQVRIEQGIVRTIHINTAQFEDLKNHPYLTFKQIGAIIQYRKQHGNYSSFADLKKVAILKAETVDKLAPYLSFDL